MMRATSIVLTALILSSGCASAGARVRPGVDSGQVGYASYYASHFEGRPTASGAAYDPKGLTAAHRTLPFGTRVRVTNVANGKAIVVTITDRGPHRRSRVIDLSARAARELGFLRAGIARVRVEPLAG